ALFYRYLENYAYFFENGKPARSYMFYIFTDSFFDTYMLESFWEGRQAVEFKHLVVHLKWHALSPVGKFAKVEIVKGFASCHHKVIGSNFLCNLDYIIQPRFFQHKF